MSLRELKKLESSARKAAAEKERLSDEKSSVDKGKTAIGKLSGELRYPTKDSMLAARIRQNMQNVQRQGAEIEANLRGNRSELADLEMKAKMSIARGRAVIEKSRAAAFQQMDRSPLDKIENEQKEQINKANDILRILGGGQDSDFDEILSMVKPYYDMAEKVTNLDFRGQDSKNFTGHTLRHILEVCGKMRSMCHSMLEMGFPADDFFSGITTIAAIVFHDTGMNAGLEESMPEINLWDVSRRDEGQLSFKEQAMAQLADSEPRKKHAVRSALHVLEDKNREKLEAMGVNAEQAAFLIYLHSKSDYLETLKERDPDGNKKKIICDLGRADFRDIKKAAENFEHFMERMGVRADMSWLRKGDSWDENALRKTAVSASALRLADANRDGVNIYAQNGANYVFSNKEACRGREPILDKNGRPKEDEMHREIEGMYIACDHGNNRLEELKPDVVGPGVNTNKSRAIIFGERNIDSMNAVMTKDGNRFVYRFMVNDPGIGIGCTAYAAQERINEVKSTVFGNLKAFMKKDVDLVIEVLSPRGSAKRIADCLDFPEPWHLVYEEQ